MTEGDFLWKLIAVVTPLLSVAVMWAKINSVAKTKIEPQPLNVAIEKEYLRKESFYKHVAQHAHEHDTITSNIRELEKVVADQKGRSEVNGARLVEIAQKLDRVIERVKA